MKVSLRSAFAAVLSVSVLVATLLTTALPAEAIVGGTVENPADFAYFVRVEARNSEGTGTCGGSIIAATWVLTAAHCVTGYDIPTQFVVCLVNSDPCWLPGHTESTAAEVIVHPLWDGDASDGHDLALIRLEPGVAPLWTSLVTPLQVGAPWDPSAYAAGTEATIMGVGATSPSGDAGIALRAADTPLRSDEYMDDIFNHWWWFDGWNEPLMIGAGATHQTVCFGDSGGPLVVARNGRPVEVGVASMTYTSAFDDGCDAAGAFAELDGAQLAWVASRVPSIMLGWGGCLTAEGYHGHAAVTYDPSYLPGAAKDGPYYWAISCVVSPLPVPIMAVAAARDSDGRMELFGSNINGFVFDRWERSLRSPRSTTWSGWVQFDGQVESVAAESNADGRLELFGSNGSGFVFHRWQFSPGSVAWSKWVQFDGQVDHVAAARNADGRLELFGSNGSGFVFHRWQLSPGSDAWSNWVQFDGQVNSVAAESNADGRLELFGSNGSGFVFHRWQLSPGSAAWSGWEQFDGQVDHVAAARNADGRLELFGSNGSGFVFHRWQLSPGGDAWSSWVQFDGQVDSVAAESTADGRLELFGSNGGGTVFHRAQLKPGSDAWSSWVEFDNTVETIDIRSAPALLRSGVSSGRRELT